MADRFLEILDLPTSTEVTVGYGDYLLIKQGDVDRKISIKNVFKWHTDRSDNPHSVTKTQVGLDKLHNWDDELDYEYPNNDKYANIGAVRQLWEDLQIAISSSVPTGCIMLWSGSANTIPSGYALCDGSSGTPNLKDRFVVGAGSSYNVGSAGGVVNNNHTHTGSGGGTVLTWRNLPPHQHAGWGSEYPTWPFGKVPTTTKVSGDDDKDFVFSYSLSSATIYNTPNESHDGASSHSHSVSVGSTNLDNRPPYYALAYIMKL